MPALFLNPEVGVCRSEELAIQSISRTLLAYAVLRRHITAWEQEENTFGRLSLYYKEGRTASIHELLPKMNGNLRNLFQIFFRDILRGNIIETPQVASKTLKSIDIQSPFLEYAFEQQGIALSFADDPYWEKDFIEFNEDNASLPNIWGQTDFQPIHAWLDAFYRNTSGYDGIQTMFNVEFCCDNITRSTFTPYQWSLIYETFRKAADKDFNVCHNLIKHWNNLPIFYIRDRNHTDFTLRIFFIKCNGIIYVGEIYHKNTDNTLKEEAAADRSYKSFCKRNIF